MSDVSKIENQPGYLFGLQMTSHLAWVTGSVTGALFGGLIDPRSFGIPFALPALFICLLILQIKRVHHFYVLLIAGMSSFFFKLALPGNWYILLTALLASGIGMAIKTKLIPSPSTGEGEGGGEGEK